MLTRKTPMRRSGFARSKVGSTSGARNVPMARSSGLARNTPIRKFREEPRRLYRATGRTDEVTPEERVYMNRVRAMRCCALGQAGHDRCDGPPIVHHAGRHGTGFKSSHFETIRLCDKAHRELHDTPATTSPITAGGRQ